MVHIHEYIRYCIIVLLWVLTSKNSYSQENLGKAPDFLRQRVNTIDSFINRFNYEEDNIGNLLPLPEGAFYSDSYVGERKKQILSLFDKKIPKALVGEFLLAVNSVSKQNKLNFYDKQWYADVQMDVLYKQQPQKINLILQIEETQPHTSKWTIRSIKAPFLEIHPKEADTVKIIPPNSHSTDFISLPLNLSNPKSIAQFSPKEAPIDFLSIFLYAVYNGEIEFKQTTHVAFHFLQIDNWILKVEEFNRSFLDNGWQVAELIKADTSIKREYAAKQLNIR